MGIMRDLYAVMKITTMVMQSLLQAGLQKTNGFEDIFSRFLGF